MICKIQKIMINIQMILTMWYCFIVPLFHSFSKYFLNARYFIKYGGGKIYRTQVFDTRSIKKKKKQMPIKPDVIVWF